LPLITPITVSPSSAIFILLLIKADSIILPEPLIFKVFSFLWLSIIILIIPELPVTPVNEFWAVKFIYKDLFYISIL